MIAVGRWEEGINAIEEALSPDEVFKRLHQALEGQLPTIRQVFRLSKWQCVEVHGVDSQRRSHQSIAVHAAL